MNEKYLRALTFDTSEYYEMTWETPSDELEDAVAALLLGLEHLRIYCGVLKDNVLQLKDTIKLKDDLQRSMEKSIGILTNGHMEMREELEYQLQIAEQSNWPETAQRLRLILDECYYDYGESKQEKEVPLSYEEQLRSDIGESLS